MSGIQQLLVGGGALYVGNITIAQSTAFTSRLGYARDTGGAGNVGSIEPVSAGLRGRVLEYALSDSVNTFADFAIQLGGTAAQTWFTTVRVWDYNNLVRTFHTNAVTSYNQFADAVWRWGDGSNAVWRTTTDIGLIRRIEFY